jgi:anti-sigma regulatory factor (Ser/Thr protein kinase)
MQSASTRIFVLPAQPALIEAHVRVIEEALPLPLRGDLLRIGLTEVLTNAIVHGALGVGSEARDEGDVEKNIEAIEEAARRLSGLRHVEVDVSTNGSSAEIEVSDPGPGFDWRNVKRRYGLGLSIIRQAFAAVHWNEAGNRISLRLESGS